MQRQTDKPDSTYREKITTSLVMSTKLYRENTQRKTKNTGKHKKTNPNPNKLALVKKKRRKTHKN